MTRIRRAVVVALALASVAAPAAAQESYPVRPITLVVPFPPGGVADLTARPLAPALERALIVDELGPDRVVIGSDYPFDMGSDDPVRAVESAGLGPAARSAIVDGANAARFLGLSPG